LKEMKSAYTVLVGIHEGKRPLRQPRHKWEDSIRMDLGEIQWKSVDWICLAQNRNQWQFLMNTIMNL